MVFVQDGDDGNEHVVYYLRQNLIDTETLYSHFEKLALATVHVVHRYCHYILLRKTTVISYCNTMTYILTHQFLGGKYSKWIVILQDFDLDFIATKSKKTLVYVELICALPSANTSIDFTEQIPDENLFLINALDPWYKDIIVYL